MLKFEGEEVSLINECPGYGVTKSGKVISYKKVKMYPNGYAMSPGIKQGYESVALRDKDGNNVYWQVHRLIASVFLEPKDGCNIVNHIDGNKSNNALSNLEWTDRKGNAKHYEQIIAPKKRAMRVQRKVDDVNSRLSVIAHARQSCKDNIELFLQIVDSALVGAKI
jgi:hypothetical protein